MLRSFIQSDVYRIMLGCESRETMLAAIAEHAINHDGGIRVMRRDDGAEIAVTVLFLDGDVLEKLALCEHLKLLQVDNISARLRAVPPLPNMRDSDRSRAFVRRAFGQAA